MSAFAPNSCSQCSRPLAIESASGLCNECLASAPTLDGKQASSQKRTPMTADTASHGSPAALLIPKPIAAQYGSTLSEAVQTRTPRPDEAGFELTPDRGHLPEPPPGYDLLEGLGHGGMGRVYLAREHAAERVVAIKFLNSPNSSTAFDRFLVEVRAQAKLKHPHIVEVISVEVSWREPYFTMEHAAGGSLAEYTKPERLLPPREAARMVQQAAEGVAFAHANNVLHRDLKPSNILLAKSASGEVSAKVSDFGLAKRTDRDDGLTMTGVLGTAAYMSPEAAAGRNRDIGPASDVYGLGATLYHLLTGRPPFTGDDNHQIVEKVKHEPVARLRALRPDLPVELEAIVMKSLERLPSRRYSSAGELAADLKQYLDGGVPAAPIHSRRRRLQRWFERNCRRVALAVGAVLLAAGLVAAGRYLQNESVPGPPVDPVAEHLASVKSKLQAGETVTLIGETGLPKYHRFWFEESVLQAEPNGTCSFRAFGTNLLELMPPEMGLDHYEVQLELQHLRAAIPGPAANLDADSVGFYFGHAFDAVGNARTAHVLYSLQYKDYEMPVGPGVPRTRGAHLLSTGFLVDPAARDGVEVIPSIKHAAIAFTPAPSQPGGVRPEPGKWRPIIAEVGPAGIRVQWLADPQVNQPPKMVDVANWTREVSDRNYSLQVTQVAERLKLKSLPLKWSPSLGFGIRASKSAVAVRNVRVTPLPRRT